MIERIGSVTEAEALLVGTDAAVFDLDDTLYSEKDYVRSGFEAAAALFPDMPDAAGRLWKAFESGKPAFDEVFGGSEESLRAAEALRVYRNHTPRIRLYPGVREMLTRLHAGKKLGLITDGRPEGQRAKTAALGIEELFDEIIITDELGGPEHRKPSPEAFELMSRRLNVPFGRMAYIGDNISKDFTAPEKLGIRCIWFSNTDGLYYKERK